MYSLGVALVVGSLIDFPKQSQELTNFVSEIMQQVVISKDFFRTLSQEHKRESLKLILQPTHNQIKEYSNISYFFEKEIDHAISMFDTNFKSNVSIHMEVRKDDKRNKVVTKGILSYRIYKVNDEYTPIQVIFERENSEILSRRLISPQGVYEFDIKGEINSKETRGNTDYYCVEFKIPSELKNYPYLTLESEVEEVGFNHWTNFHWTALTPYDGLNCTINCYDDLIVHECIIFDAKEPYYINLSRDKSQVRITATQWLNAYTGFSVTIGQADREEG